MGVKFGMEEGNFGPLLHAKLHSHRCNVSPLRGEKLPNRPLSKLNTGRLALRAMLPVMTLTDLQGHSPIQRRISYTYASVPVSSDSTSRGTYAMDEPLVPPPINSGKTTV